MNIENDSPAVFFVPRRRLFIFHINRHLMPGSETEHCCAEREKGSGSEQGKPEQEIIVSGQKTVVPLIYAAFCFFFRDVIVLPAFRVQDTRAAAELLRRGIQVIPLLTAFAGHIAQHIVCIIRVVCQQVYCQVGKKGI